MSEYNIGTVNRIIVNGVMAQRLGRVPEAFSLESHRNLSAEFELWLEDFEAYLSLQDIKSSKQRKDLLLNIGGIGLRRVAKGLDIASPQQGEGEASPDVYSPLKDALCSYFRPSVNITAERHRFRCRRQKQEESVTAYVSSLRALAAECEFEKTDVDSVTNCLIRDQFMEGLESADIRRELLAISKLSLAAAVAKAEGLETSLKDSKLYESRTKQETPQLAPLLAQAADSINQTRSSQNRQSARATGSESASNPGCGYCGRQHEPGRKNCPAANVTCNKCGKRGHFALVCRSRKTDNQVSSLEDEALSCFEVAYTLDPSLAAEAMHDPRYWVSLTINGKMVSGLLDTGATRTVCPCTVLQPEQPPDRHLRAYGGREVETLGMARATFSANGRSVDCHCFVVSPQHCVLFGQDVISGLGLVEVIKSVEVINLVEVSPVQIDVESGANPVASPCRRHAFSIRDEIKAEIERMIAAGVIEPVKRATPWVSPIVPSRKSNGKLRLCIDYRQLNAHIVRERRMMPTVEEITAQMHDMKIFSVLDAESGFHQIPLAVKSRPLTTFICHIGLFQFKRLPFGIACAPEVFQRVMNDLLAGIPGVHVYIDDILVSGSDMDEHDNRLRQVVERLDKAKLKLNWSKCQLRQDKVKYLGHILDECGVHPDPNKVKAIMEMPDPSGLADIQRILGMLTYLGKFLPGLADATAPLRRLAR